MTLEQDIALRRAIHEMMTVAYRQFGLEDAGEVYILRPKETKCSEIPDGSISSEDAAPHSSVKLCGTGR